MRLLALFVLALYSAPAVERPKVTAVTLKNGMKLILEEDHDIPTVAMSLFYKVGSRNEGPGTTGISHFFEHMMFNGAKKYGPKQFDIVMEKNGGANNAYTSQDTTVYLNWFPRSALRLIFDMEADRIQNLSFDPKMIESERGVVYSERQMRVDNSNFGALFEQFNATAFAAHPYGWPVLGWASDIQSWTMQDLKNHFRMGYAPNNCVAVLVGDFATEEVLALAREFWEPIPSQDPPPPVRTVEPEQRGERRVIVRKAAELPVQMIAYHGVRTNHPDYRPLQVLSAIMTQGRSSRLYKRLVDTEQLALSVSQNVFPSLDPGLIFFTIRPRAGVDVGKTEKILFEEIERIASAEVPAGELRKGKNLLLTDMYREMTTISGRADLLGQHEIYLGSYERLFTAGKEIEAVTAADVLRVARAYLKPDRRTIATLVPEARP